MKLNFCPECAAKLIQKSVTSHVCQNGHLYWNNPAATVAIVLLKGKKILISKRGIEPNKGKYDLPGGFLEYGEDPLEAARREIKEEAGLEINDLAVIAAYTGYYFENESVCDLIVLAKQWEGTPIAQDDSEGLEWRPLKFLSSKDFVPNYTGLSKILMNTL